MKQLFGFVLLIAVALLLLTVISGIGGVFSSIAATWTVDQTAQIASGLSEVLWLGGIVTVMTLGYGLFINMSKGSRGWSTRSSSSQDAQYQIIDAQPQTQQHLIGMKQEPITDWIDFQPEQETYTN